MRRPVFQAFYGGTREPAGWSMLGFQPVPQGVATVDPQPLIGIGADAVAPEYDVIVVGGGGGGGFAAYELARRGQRVLLVERSRPFHDSELRGNHLQGKRQELYDVTAGPGKGSPRVLELVDGSTRLLPGDGSGTNRTRRHDPRRRNPRMAGHVVAIPRGGLHNGLDLWCA